ncbi:flagellar motor switch protein FliG [Sphingosinicella microcystinivorans]|uniref:flagellar motor switch protein FliG n=1 Tax=Sphingosinicella microcystinivorans TaxID=335406 RepID=UPI0022F3DF2C|nr:flagellar motor switch protein FliG [Sphingosinicella microcystinivorans]WBX83729.1 flagellar motor switch protein FliG [Sphingosinicella microcystinivorans]
MSARTAALRAEPWDAPMAPFSGLTGIERAAALMLALGREHGGAIWAHLGNDEARVLSAAMARRGPVPAPLAEQLLTEFAGEVSNAAATDTAKPIAETMWDTLGEVNEDALAAYLRDEHPQTVAVVLGRIGRDHAARVLSRLPDDFAMDVVLRMLRTGAVRQDVLEEVEQTLRAELLSNLSHITRRDAHEMMAEIFNHLDRSAEERFMLALEDRAFDAAERIRTLMFTFEDLARLDPASVQTLLRNVDKNRLAAALKGAGEALREFFFMSMSERAARILREDMELMGPIRLREAEEAQQAIVQVAKQLADAGEIVLADNRDGSEEFVF